MTRYPLIAATLAVALAGPALAQQAIDYGRNEITVRIDARDLDLNTEAGADTLLRRLSAAARRACGGQPEAGVDLLQKMQEFRACTARSLDAAVAQVRSPLVQQRLAAQAGDEGVRLVRR